MAPKTKAMAAPPSRQRQDDDKILQELLEHNDFFDRLVDMIPSKLYIAGQSGDDWNLTLRQKNGQEKEGTINGGSSKYYHTKEPGPDTKEARRAAAKEAKRRKLDPSLAESTSQLKARLDTGSHHRLLPTRPDSTIGIGNTAKDAATKENPQKLTPRPGADSSPQTPSAADAKAGSAAEAAADAPPASPPTSDDQSRIERLRAKLQAKLAALTSERPPPDQVSKRAARRAERVRRRQLAAQSKAHGTTSTTTAPAKPAWTMPAAAATFAPQMPAVVPEALGFGRLTGLYDAASDPHPSLADNKSLANLSKKKNLKKLVADAEAKREQLEKWKHSADEADKQRARDAQWADALSEAAGKRVKDDPAKLKKALKQRAAKKAKSQKAWQSRLETVAASKDARQKQRTQNLQARRNRKLGLPTEPAANANPEVGSSTKNNGTRRLSRAGFEGRKHDFLNGSSGGAKKKD